MVIMRSAVLVFLASFFFSISLFAQERCKVTWLSPGTIGELINIQPGEYIGSWFKSFEGGSSGIRAYRVSVKFAGRTGEKTFDLEVLRWVLAEDESSEIRKYYLAPSDTLTINLISFQVIALNGSFLRFVMLGHPESQEMGLCVDVKAEKS